MPPVAMDKLSLIAAILMLAIVSGVASGKSPDAADSAEARRHFETGLAHFNLQEFDRAIDELQAAYRLHPDPAILYNIAQAHRLNNNPERALYFYRAYLRGDPQTRRRDDVQRRIATLEQLLTVKRDVAKPPDTAIAPDEKSQAAVVSAPSSAPSPAPSSAPSPAPSPSLAVAPAAPAPSPAVAMTARPREKLYKKWWLWTAVGAVVAGTAVGVGISVGTHRTTPTYPSVLF
jgi:tetratricopeptide (TPR) repeat protein